MVCVGGLLVSDGRVLLGLRSTSRTHFPDVWDVFGGHAWPGEPPGDALARELHEELGVTPTSVSLLHIAQHSGAAESYEYRIYLVTAWEGTPENRQPEEHDKIRWVSPEQFGGMRFAHPAYLRLFRQAIELTGSASDDVG
jgi:8-oxo-dGTP diphosphatase